MPSSPVETALIEIMVQVFRLNGRLLDVGDRLVGPAGLTSARWQVLGPVALAGRPLTAPQIAQAMGISRQGVQKQLDLLHAEGLMERRPNPAHERSPLHALTPAGEAAYAEAMRRCRLWAADLAAGLDGDGVLATRQMLACLLERLDRPPPEG